MSNDRLSPAALAQFTGSEHWYRHGLVREILFTDGAKYVADQGGAYWLIDLRPAAHIGFSTVTATRSEP